MLNVAEAALVALLCKLLANKSFNKDTHGHHWTQEADLLGQAPVSRTDIPHLRAVAEEILQRYQGSLFLTKGANQGKTKKEWCINTAFLPAVKQAIIHYSFAPLRSEPGLAPVLAVIEADVERTISFGSDVVRERIRLLCQQ